MEVVVYLLLPLALLFVAGAVAAFRWAVLSGQLDDTSSPPVRMLFDETDRGETREAGE